MMVEAGLLEEVAGSGWHPDTRQQRTGHRYKELIPWLDGEEPLEDCLDGSGCSPDDMPSVSSPGSGGTIGPLVFSRMITV